MKCPHCDHEIDAEITDVMAATRELLTTVIDSANEILHYGTPAERTKLTATLLNKLMSMSLSEQEDVDVTVREQFDDLLRDLSNAETDRS